VARRPGPVVSAAGNPSSPGAIASAIAPQSPQLGGAQPRRAPSGGERRASQPGPPATRAAEDAKDERTVDDPIQEVGEDVVFDEEDQRGVIDEAALPAASASIKGR